MGGELSYVLCCPAFHTTNDFLFSNNEVQSCSFHHGNAATARMHRSSHKAVQFKQEAVNRGLTALAKKEVFG